MGETKKDHGNKKESKTSDVDDHIANRYEIKRRLGKGAYGIVWKAVDNHTKEIVAVKKIFEAFRNQTDAQRTFREIMFLQAFKEHPNIIRLRGLHKATNNKDIYLIFDFMDTDLHHVIKRGSVLKDVHKRFIMYQLLRATQYLHSGNVIHRDQKPSNVLVNAECKIKIADFGLARSLAHANEDEDDGTLTDYVATRWYRAPEILVASKRYTKGVDMWSLGCILGEMLLGKPLFPGSSTVNQMGRIMAVLPEPTPQEVYSMCSGYGKGLLEGYTGPKTTLKDLVHSPCEEAMDLLNRLLVFDPSRRLTASEALKHPYVAQFFTGKELTLDKDVTPPLDDDVQLSVSDYRNKLYEMIAIARMKKKMSKTELISPADNISPPGQISDRLNQNKAMEKLARPTDYLQRISHVESKYSQVDCKQSEGSLRRRPKHSSAEDNRETRDGRENRERAHTNKLVGTRSENCNKIVTGNHRRVAASPNHRPNVPPPRVTAGWPERQRVLCSNQKAPPPVRPRYDEAGGGEGVMLRSATNNNYSQPPFRAALAQVKEKLRQAQALNSQLSTLPKVSNKRDNGNQNSSSPQHYSRYNVRHGVLTASALQEIRAVLKH